MILLHNYHIVKRHSFHHKIFRIVFRKPSARYKPRIENRYIHADFVDENISQSATIGTTKCQFGTLNCTFEELVILELIVKNSDTKQQELADTSCRSLRTVKK